MTRHVDCDWLSFDLGMQELLQGVEPEMEKGVEKAVTKNARKGAKRLREVAGARWNGKTGSTYSKGFSSRVKKAGKSTSGEIGNKNMPGLVHLLEKGHNTMAGRRVAGNRHMAPVFDEIAPKFYDDISDAVGKALDS